MRVRKQPLVPWSEVPGVRVEMVIASLFIVRPFLQILVPNPIQFCLDVEWIREGTFSVNVTAEPSSRVTSETTSSP